MKNERKKYLPQVKRLVIKIGSSLLTDVKKKRIDGSFLLKLAMQINLLKKKKIRTIIVTSGAIAAGLYELKLTKRPKDIPMLQALASIGQSNLMHAYESTFKKCGLKVGQILLTRDDISDRNRYINAHNTILKLVENDIVPIVNENDSVAVEEIKFGDNDTLSALVTHMTEADCLIILTDTDGFFDEDPQINPNAKLLSEVTQWDDNFELKATQSRSRVGTGGMITKIQAAKNMMRSGIPMIIANGRKGDVIRNIMNSKTIGTFFKPSDKKMANRKRWLTWIVKTKGEIQIDNGAFKAIVEKKKSLLPSGVQEVYGVWASGSVIRIIDSQKREVAKGICNYSSDDLKKIKGLKTLEIESILGCKSADEVVHTDDMVRTAEK